MARGFSRPHLPAAEASAFSPSAPWARSLLGRRPPPASFTAAFRLGPVGGRAALSGLPAAERRAPCASRCSPECAASCPHSPEASVVFLYSPFTLFMLICRINARQDYLQVTSPVTGSGGGSWYSGGVPWAPMMGCITCLRAHRGL